MRDQGVCARGFDCGPHQWPKRELSRIRSPKGTSVSRRGLRILRDSVGFLMWRERWYVHGPHFSQALARRRRFCRRAQRQRVFSGHRAQDGTDRCTGPAECPPVCLLQVQYVSHRGLQALARIRGLYGVNRKRTKKDDKQRIQATACGGDNHRCSQCDKNYSRQSMHGVAAIAYSQSSSPWH